MWQHKACAALGVVAMVGWWLHYVPQADFVTPRLGQTHEPFRNSPVSSKKCSVVGVCFRRADATQGGKSGDDAGHPCAILWRWMAHWAEH